MNRLSIAILAAAFAAAGSLAAPSVALADRGDRGNHSNHGNQGYGTYENRDNEGNEDSSGGPHDCVNPAGNVRGWCRHNGNNEDNGNGRHRHRGGRGSTTLSGTVLGIQGNVVTYRLDNGQVVTILDNNGTPLAVGQHYSLRVSNQNGQYVLGGNYGNNGQYGHGNQSVSGTIAIVSGNTLTFTNGRTIDISQVNGNTNGPLSTLRSITAYGYVSNGIFYAQYIR